MHIGSRFLLVIAATVAFGAADSSALSCWQCPGARDTCNYYTNATFEHCVDGCRRMGFTDEEDACNQSCGEDGMANELDCIANEHDCWRTCSQSGPTVNRPWYIPY